MNKARRRRLEYIRSQAQTLMSSLEDIRDEEHDYVSAVPENLAGSARAEEAEAALSSIDDALVNLEEAAASIEEAAA